MRAIVINGARRVTCVFECYGKKYAFIFAKTNPHYCQWIEKGDI